MPCDGKNENCKRRRELLSQLKCLVSSMDRKKPCEWDEPACNPPPNCCPADLLDNEPPSLCIPLKAVRSCQLRASVMHRCGCIKRNGLQDHCMLLDCMGRPECMTKLFPVCGPGRAALLKLTDIGDAQIALEKFYCADQARESALAAYCRLVCPENNNGVPCEPPLLITPPSSVVPCFGSAQSSSIPLQQQCNNSSSQNQYRKFHSSPAVLQSQNQPLMQKCELQQQRQYQNLQPYQYQQKQQQPYQCQPQLQQPYQHQQRQQQYYQQRQQSMPCSYSPYQNVAMPQNYQYSSCMVPASAQC